MAKIGRTWIPPKYGEWWERKDDTHINRVVRIKFLLWRYNYHF